VAYTRNTLYQLSALDRGEQNGYLLKSSIGGIAMPWTIRANMRPTRYRYGIFTLIYMVMNDFVTIITRMFWKMLLPCFIYCWSKTIINFPFIRFTDRFRILLFPLFPELSMISNPSIFCRRTSCEGSCIYRPLRVWTDGVGRIDGLGVTEWVLP